MEIDQERELAIVNKWNAEYHERQERLAREKVMNKITAKFDADKLERNATEIRRFIRGLK